MPKLLTSYRTGLDLPHRNIEVTVCQFKWTQPREFTIKFIAYHDVIKRSNTIIKWNCPWSSGEKSFVRGEAFTFHRWDQSRAKGKKFPTFVRLKRIRQCQERKGERMKERKKDMKKTQTKRNEKKLKNNSFHCEKLPTICKFREKTNSFKDFYLFLLNWLTLFWEGNLSVWLSHVSRAHHVFVVALITQVFDRKYQSGFRFEVFFFLNQFE